MNDNFWKGVLDPKNRANGGNVIGDSIPRLQDAGYPLWTKSYTISRIVPVTEMTAQDWRVLEYESLRNRAKNRIAEMATELEGFAQVNIVEKARAKDKYFWPMTNVSPSVEVPFGNEVNDEELTDKAKRLDAGHSAIWNVIVKLGTPVFVEWTFRDGKDELWDEFQKLIDSGLDSFDNLDAALAVALVLVKHKGYEFLENFIDEADDALGWAEDKGLA